VFPNKIYEIGKKLGMNKKDVDIVLNSEQNKTKVVEHTTSPLESYKGVPGRYGTLSIKDIR